MFRQKDVARIAQEKVPTPTIFRNDLVSLANVTIGGSANVAGSINIGCGATIAGSTNICGSATIGGNVSVEGLIRCPELFSVEGNNVCAHKNVVPGLTTVGVRASMGTFENPWNNVFAENIVNKNIDTINVSAGVNQLGIPCLSVCNESVNLNQNFNIVNPKTNIISLCCTDEQIDVYAPIYFQWESFHAVNIKYKPDTILKITTSNIFVNITTYDKINLILDANDVPNNTKIKIYFMQKNIMKYINYVITFKRNNYAKEYESLVPHNKIIVILNNDKFYKLN